MPKSKTRSNKKQRQVNASKTAFKKKCIKPTGLPKGWFGQYDLKGNLIVMSKGYKIKQIIPPMKNDKRDEADEANTLNWWAELQKDGAVNIYDSNDELQRTTTIN